MIALIVQRFRQLASFYGFKIAKTRSTGLACKKMFKPLNPSTMQKLTEDMALLSLEYRLLTLYVYQQLLELDSLNQEPFHLSDALKQNIHGLIHFNDLLAHITQKFGQFKYKLKKLQAEKNLFLDYLAKPYQHQAELVPAKTDQLFKKIRFYHGMINRHRIVVVRAKRGIDASVAVFQKIPHYAEVIQKINQWINPIFRYAAWLFFIPRFLAHSLSLIAHLIPGFWMSEAEKKLTLQARLAAMRKIAFEWINDAAWVVNGILGCFLFRGVLNGVGIHLTACVHLLESFMAIAALAQACDRIDRLKKRYKDVIDSRYSGNFIQLLDKVSAYKKRKQIIHLINVFLLFAALTLTIPTLGMGPITILAAHIFIVCLTLLTRAAIRANAGSNPKKEWAACRQRFFQPPPRQQEKPEPLQKVEEKIEPNDIIKIN